MNNSSFDISKIDTRNVTFRVKKDNQTIHKENKEQKSLALVEIIGDSMLNNINPHGLSKNGNIKVLNYSGATSEDLKDHSNPSLKRKPDILICHIGTNDITNGIDTIQNLQIIVNRVKKKAALSLRFLLYLPERIELELKTMSLI